MDVAQFREGIRKMAPEQEGSAFVADANEAWREILCVVEERTVAADLKPKPTVHALQKHDRLTSYEQSSATRRLPVQGVAPASQLATPAGPL